MLNNEKGFTMIEMMIVLLVISVLLFVTIPNVTSQSNKINSKGCEAFMNMVEGQVEAYKMDGNTEPVSMAELVTKKYLNPEYQKCPDGSSLTIDAGGNVVKVSVGD
ncbi:competence type IV pilus major pilin ComGC [Bacillus sp. Marseille-Q1617]|uniref:competence type IV pilus major pilin ComGC n=1 Tax=Bacillus sp. Marseille-Q1617 TaxID=2736887 RepID=UPI00158F5475|nr:competence type IV pilus major pilin ComGC [Bacillus sp. Marseille-Q1617]